MVGLKAEREDWAYWKTKYTGSAFFLERIFGILYFNALKSVTVPRQKYQVTVDNDSFMDLPKAISVCQRLAKANNYLFDISIGYRKFNEMIKYPDYVAAATRRITDTKKFRPYANLTLKGAYISEEDAYKAFRLDKRNRH